VRYWDSSAVVPLVILEPGSAATTEEFGRDPTVVTWWGTRIECASALATREREGRLMGPGVDSARLRLRLFHESWQDIEPSERLGEIAMRLVRTHPLRAGDALQLAAAIVAAEGVPASLPFVTLDDRLAEAASKEGFPVVRPRAA